MTSIFVFLNLSHLIISGPSVSSIMVTATTTVAAIKARAQPSRFLCKVNPHCAPVQGLSNQGSASHNCDTFVTGINKGKAALLYYTDNPAVLAEHVLQLLFACSLDKGRALVMFSPISVSTFQIRRHCHLRDHIPPQTGSSLRGCLYRLSPGRSQPVPPHSSEYPQAHCHQN